MQCTVYPGVSAVKKVSVVTAVNAVSPVPNAVYRVSAVHEESVRVSVVMAVNAVSPVPNAVYRGRVCQ